MQAKLNNYREAYVNNLLFKEKSNVFERVRKTAHQQTHGAKHLADSVKVTKRK
jgi:hypothetical protein